MQHILTLLISITIASLGNARETTLKRIQNPCPCPGSCYHHHSHRIDHVRIMKYSSPNSEKIYCLSSEPVTWTFGSNLDQMPQINHSELEYHSSTSKDKQFCLSLKVLMTSPSWNTSTTLVKCKTNRTGSGSSRWYQLKPKKFDPQGINFNPKVTSEYIEETSSADQTVSVPVTIIIAAVTGIAAFMILLLIILLVLLKKVKKQRKKIEMTNEEIDEFMLGVAAEKANAKGINGLFVLPYDTRLEIPKSEVHFRSTILGSGAFGQVVRGTYRGTQVAIKMLKNNGNSNADYLRSLLGELKVMSYLGSHPNLVGLIGAITRSIKDAEVYLIFECCSKGNAQKFVRDHRDTFLNIFAGPFPPHPRGMRRTPRFSRLSKLYGTVLHGIRLTTKDLVRWSYEVASGMDYVSSKNVYHGDLAARNILLTGDLTAKVGDFGLSKQLDMEKYNCYVQKKECPLPLKWMAIESLRDLTFSIQSDVWSFGVTMWELFTLGTTPYPGMDWNFESWKLLCEGKRLDKPEYASDSLYDVMVSCWSADPKSRPMFGRLRDLLKAELHKL